LDDFQAGTLAILLTNLRVRVDNLIMELADSLLQPTMALEKISERRHDSARRYPYLLEIRAVVALR
jgi:hypothetical protein